MYVKERLTSANERRRRSCKGNEGRKAAGERGGEHKQICEMQLQIQHYQAGLIAP